MEEKPDARNARFVNNFAIIVALTTILSLGALVVISLWAINDEKAFERFNGIFTAVLPVLATWMGTLLAYYFTKENFMAANQAQKDLIAQFTSSAQKLESIKAPDVMIPWHDIKKLVWEEGKTEATPLTEFLRFFSENKFNRMVIADADDRLRTVVHESTFNEFIVRYIRDNPGKTIQEITVKDFFDAMATPAFQDLASYVNKGAEFIAYACNLKDAQQMMEKNRNCQDVFVTPKGDRTEKVLGWITNRIVEDNARL